MRVESTRCLHIYLIKCGKMSDIYKEYIYIYILWEEKDK